MTWKDGKYLFAYIGPIAAFISVGSVGFWTYSAVVLAFILIPFIELFLEGNDKVVEYTDQNRSANKYFDLLLYLNVPIIYGLIFFYLTTITGRALTSFEIVGMTLGVGVMTGSALKTRFPVSGDSFTYTVQDLGEVTLRISTNSQAAQ